MIKKAFYGQFYVHHILVNSFRCVGFNMTMKLIISVDLLYSARNSTKCTKHNGFYKVTNSPGV